jgi:hypothetical protein
VPYLLGCYDDERGYKNRSVTAMNNHEKFMEAVKAGEIPTVEYPKEYLEELNKEFEETMAAVASGELPVYNSVEELFAALGYDMDGNTIPAEK